MSERSEYPAGVPCWVETLQPDVDAALAFYGQVFGWDMAGPGPMVGGGMIGNVMDDARYYVARLRGRDVAGIGSLPGPHVPVAWLTSVAVADMDAALESVMNAGGTVVTAAYDAAPAGRGAVVADPTGGVHGLWEGAARAGAQLINEPGAWAMSQLSTPDPAKAAEFYAAAYGWTTETFGAGDGAAALFRLPGYVGGLPQQPVSHEVVAVMVPGRGAARWTPNFWIPDVGAVERTAAGLGATTVVPAFPSPAGTTVVMADPQGAVFSVTEVGRKG